MNSIHSSNRLAIWIHASRPKTLWAGIAPVLIGTAMAQADGAFHAPAALAALAFALLVQIGTNFCNDYADFKKGADTEDRQGPLRVTQAGLIKPETMLRATALVFALALIVGGWLIWRGGWPAVIIGILSVVSGVLYTAGPRPLGYVGLGELFVLIFFGPVAVGGTYYVQALTINPPVIISGLAPGLLSVAILVVNNLRDIQTDAKAGKKTLAVRFGAAFARLEYLICLLVALLIPPGLFLATGRHPFALAVLLLAPLALTLVRTVFAQSSGAVLNPVLGHTAKLLLFYSLLFSLGWTL